MYFQTLAERCWAGFYFLDPTPLEIKGKIPKNYNANGHHGKRRNEKNWANNINQEYISSKVVFTNLRNRITSRRSFCFLQNIFCPIWYTSLWLFLLLYSITNALQRNVACLTIFRVNFLRCLLFSFPRVCLMNS